mmetsp:Transcript_119351/g.237882  ORF Transcript_119351/g.237882 Transcript_119351/m.237882 type:complete len:251 (+) Transcript_119351:57-809(+)|eukprot:CAMPEP_0172669842 /NCGR_PEP_ID=MMETSP1074-20121228/9932_1 /TAXON_ID=2916 /ORGANISM="Ceratium fusus, Strain PA161109" /LENGTH=250 /DNA_ID=CAMNT_0013486673 /DNA_START=53 /DNA_END=805 /DNA_ORIENTATION=+
MAIFAKIVFNAVVASAVILQLAMATRESRQSAKATKEDKSVASFQKDPVGANKVIAFYPDASCFGARMFEVSLAQTDCYQLTKYTYDNKDLYFTVVIGQKKVSLKFGSNMVCGASIYESLTTNDKEFSVEGSSSSTTCLAVDQLGLDFKGIALTLPIEEIHARKAAREKAKPCNEIWKSAEQLLRGGSTLDHITWNEMEKKILPAMFGLNEWPINQDVFKERADTVTESHGLKAWSQKRFCELMLSNGTF